MRFIVENYIAEGIADVKKYYPTISDEDFDRIINLDPTTNIEKDKVGTYSKWLLNLFKNNKLNNEGHVKDLLTRFNTEKNRLKNKDIMTYKSIEAVDDALNDDTNYNQLSARQELRQTQKAVRNTNVSEDAKLVYEDNKWEMWVPQTYEASCKLGQGSNWCTASTSSDYYYNHYKERYGGNYYILINKLNPDEKYQFHFESHQFMNKADYPIQLGKFLSENKGIADHFGDMLYKYLPATDLLELFGAEKLKEHPEIIKHNIRNVELMLKLFTPNEYLDTLGGSDEDFYTLLECLEDFKRIANDYDTDKYLDALQTLIDDEEELYLAEIRKVYAIVGSDLFTEVRWNKVLSALDDHDIDDITDYFYDYESWDPSKTVTISNDSQFMDFFREKVKEEFLVGANDDGIVTIKVSSEDLAKGDTDLGVSELDRIMTGNAWDIFEGYDDDYNYESCDDCVADLSDKTLETLKNDFNLTKEQLFDITQDEEPSYLTDEQIETIRDALTLAYIDGKHNGVANECSEDFINAFEDALSPEMKWDSHGWDNPTKVDINEQWFLTDKALKTLLNNHGDVYDAETLTTFYIQEHFKFKQPYYGWDGFSQADFEYRLLMELDDYYTKE